MTADLRSADPDDYGWMPECDWGYCSGATVAFRLDIDGNDEWLPVCVDHLFGPAGTA